MPANNVWDASEVALVIIDYQEEMFRQFTSSDPREIELNIKFLINIANAFNIPIVLSTVGVKMGVNQPTRKSIKNLMPAVEEIDRSSMDAWEDPAFRKAVEATGKKRLIFCALYTEICLAYPVVEALNQGYEVTFVADAVAGLTNIAHKMAIKRLIQAGAVPNTTFALATELFRDWKSPFAAKARPLTTQYLHEHRELDVDEHPEFKNINYRGQAIVQH
jgi:nicotinamidase-related amidase